MRVNNEAFIRNRMWEFERQITKMARFMMLREAENAEIMPIRKVVLVAFTSWYRCLRGVESCSHSYRCRRSC